MRKVRRKRCRKAEMEEIGECKTLENRLKHSGLGMYMNERNE